MSIDTVHITSLFVEGFSSSFIREYINECFSRGYSTEQSGENKWCFYSSKSNDYDYKKERTGTAIETLANDKHGSVQLWFDDVDFNIQIDLRSNIYANSHRLTLSIDAVHFKWREGRRVHENVQGVVDEFIDLINHLYEFAHPSYVYGGASIILKEDHESGNLRNVTDGKLATISWLNILGPKTVAQIGKDSLLSAPAWKVNELNDGGVLLVLADNPVKTGEIDDARERVEDHLGFL